jgi:hypothetical protein
VFAAFPFFFFFFFLRSITRLLVREEERLAHIAELAGGRFEAEEKAQERERNGTSGLHGGAATSLRMTRTSVLQERERNGTSPVQRNLSNDCL